MLVGAAENALSGDEAARLREHLDACETCRMELAGLRTAVVALRGTLEELAPRRNYLTEPRLQRLMAYYHRGPKIFRLVTYRQFVAAAAAVAIVVSTAFIAANAIRMQQPLREPPMVTEVPAPRYIPVVLAASGQGEPLNVVRPLSPGGWPAAVAGAPAGGELASTSSAHMTIPVNHAFYDPEESSHWW
jgi:hypothetical protein